MKRIRYKYNRSGIYRVYGVSLIFIFLVIQLMFIPSMYVRAENDEVIVNTQSELQEALNSDVSIIKIDPQDGQDLILNKPLTISKSRTVKLTSDRPIKIIGASGQWLLITGSDNDVSIQFSNVTLDGNNASGGIYNRGPLKLENAVIQNCNYTNGGSGIYSISNLTISNSQFTNNVANKNPTIDGGAIYARGLTSRITVKISNSTFKNSNSRYGGAVRIDNADIQMKNCEFENSTSTQGACIYVADASDLNMTNCTLTRNIGSGAIFVNNSDLTLTDSIISNNNGRGIYGYSSVLDVNITVNGNTVISGNAAKTSYGGGIIGYTEGAPKVTINIKENAVISGNEAVTGGGVSSYPDSNVIINMSGNAQIINNVAYENGGGIYGEGTVNISGGKISSNTAVNGGGIYGVSGTDIHISNAIINENKAAQDGGGIWAADLSALTVKNSIFQNNSASTGFFWRINNPGNDNQAADAIIHQKTILNTTFTEPYTNAHNNYDINYKTDIILVPLTVTYHANNNDSGTIPIDQNNPYVTGETVTILEPSDSFSKSDYRFAGWNTAPDGSGDQFTYDSENHRSNPQSFIMDDANIILYAQWEEVETTANGQSDITTPGQTETLTSEHPGTTPESGNAVISDYPPEYRDGYTLVPQEDGSYEVLDQDNTPIGLWEKNGDDEWTYEEYPSEKDKNYWAFLYGILLFLGLPIAIYFFLIARRHITREEFVRMIIQAISLELEIENSTPYSDVSEDDKYYPAIMNAWTAGLLSGFPESEFRPKDAITREELANVLAETIRYSSFTLTLEKIDLSTVFNDIDSINEIFLEDIRLVVQLEIMQERGDRRFEPDGLSTKRQAKKIINDLMALISPYLPSNPENSSEEE